MSAETLQSLSVLASDPSATRIDRQKAREAIHRLAQGFNTPSGRSSYRRRVIAPLLARNTEQARASRPAATVQLVLPFC